MVAARASHGDRATVGTVTQTASDGRNGDQQDDRQDDRQGGRQDSLVGGQQRGVVLPLALCEPAMMPASKNRARHGAEDRARALR